MHICLLAVLHQIQCLPGWDAVSTAKGCISYHLNSHFSCMPRRSCMAWRTARHLCYVHGSKCPLFSPIRMIRLSLDVLRKNKPLALLSVVLPYGKCKPQETVLALNHFRQSLATDIFKALLKIGFHSPVSFSIQFSFCNAPHPHYFSLNWNASHHCFLSTPLARLVIYCTSAFCKPQPTTKKDWALHVLLSTRAENKTN